MAKFDINKRDKVLRVLERAWLHSLKTNASRLMIADLITKELYGDDDGYLNNTAYGDKPITPQSAKVEVPATDSVKVKTEEEQVDRVPKKSKEKVVEPIVSKEKSIAPKEKPTVQKKKSKSTDLGKPKRRMLKNSKTTKRSKKDGISRFSK